MTKQEIQERNKQIALMLGADVQDTLEKIYIDKMIDNELTFHNMSVNLNTYEWNGTTNIHYIPFDMLQFHSDWNWLHEAINKIRDLAFTFEIRHDFSVTRPDVLHISIYNRHLGGPDLEIVYIETNVSKEIESTFIAVSDFAKKFNNKEL
jgi:hypothetical protein